MNNSTVRTEKKVYFQAEPKSSEKKPSWMTRLTPWMAGTGFALGHVMTTSNCTIPQQGRCSTCGGCVVALGSLVAWAVIKNRKGEEFYIESSS